MPGEIDQDFISMVFKYVESGNRAAISIINELDVAKQITVLRATDKYGWNLLHWAIYKNHDDLAQLIIEKSLERNINITLELRTGTGWFNGNETPLHIALRYCSWRTEPRTDKLNLMLLDKGANPGNIDQNGRTALHWAAQKNRASVITSILLNCSEQLPLAQDSKGNTALHIAVSENNRAAIEALAFYKNGVLLHVHNNDNNTPLQLMRESHEDEIKLLAERLAAVYIQQQAQLTTINHQQSSTVQAVPDEFKDPITHEIMVDPVITADGHSYERASITRWFLMGHHTSPLTNARLANQDILPNHSLRQAIENYQRLRSHQGSANTQPVNDDKRKSQRHGSSRETKRARR